MNKNFKSRQNIFLFKVILTNFKSNFILNIVTTIAASFYFCLALSCINLENDFVYILNLMVFFIFSFYSINAIFFGIRINKKYYFNGKQSYLHFAGISREAVFLNNLFSVILYFMQKYILFIFYCILILSLRNHFSLFLDCLNILSNVLLNDLLIYFVLLSLYFWNKKVGLIMEILLIIGSTLFYLNLFLDSSFVSSFESNKIKISIMKIIKIRFEESIPIIGTAFSASFDSSFIFKILNTLISVAGILILFPVSYLKNKTVNFER